MNLQTQTQTQTSSRAQPQDRGQHAQRPAGSTRPTRDRAREFGVGYGNSSGYASARHYLASQCTPRFHFA